jgi:hypothetical protein
MALPIKTVCNAIADRLNGDITYASGNTAYAMTRNPTDTDGAAVVTASAVRSQGDANDTRVFDVLVTITQYKGRRQQGPDLLDTIDRIHGDEDSNGGIAQSGYGIHRWQPAQTSGWDFDPFQFVSIDEAEFIGEDLTAMRMTYETIMSRQVTSS